MVEKVGKQRRRFGRQVTLLRRKRPLVLKTEYVRAVRERQRIGTARGKKDEYSERGKRRERLIETCDKGS